MEVLPVLDLLNEIVVRGVAGRRSEYMPLRSILTASHQPLDVARALRTNFGFDKFYVADLDAILHGRMNWDTFRRFIDDGFQLLVDAGIDDASTAIQIRNVGAEPIVGLESCCSPQILAEIVTRTRAEMTFSLDLLNGQPNIAKESRDWSSEVREIARQAISSGVRRMIVLDLADVGTSTGSRTDSICRSLLQEFPKLRLTCGGGVRGIDDLLRLRALGASSVLVASALHDGRLTPAHIQSIKQH